ncbi:MAG TPA: histidine kinase N-terminal 7TM domain-containing protein [Gemmatimonadaceae bacterium]|nr:histidine kinase N-terminal 7TM domain-containing protein [Gemmatimonadaceae bacterium]HPV76433.1 histidine kinase N-terminal 7TM domain-containing protein [Gemmatimonadaceae bacterium]
MQPQVEYLLLIVVVLVLLGATVGYAWRHRRAPGALHFLAFSGAAWAWTFLVAAMALADPVSARVLLSVKYLAIGLATTSSFLFIAQRTGRLTRLSRSQLAAFFAIPVLGHVASYRDDAGMVSNVSFGEAYELTHVAAISFGPVYWLFTGYAYALILSSIAFLLFSRREGASMARVQATPLLIGVVAPLATNILLITGIAPRAFDPMPFGIALTGIGLWWGAFRHRILDLVPVARQVLVDTLHEGILIVDREGRILDVNQHFASLAGVVPARLVGMTLEQCRLPIGDMSDVLQRALSAAPASGASDPPPRHALEIGDRVFDVRVLTVAGRDASAEARIVVLQDVTERQRWQDEQARLITELQDALGQVKTLTGLLPICSGCKKIRDDVGDWQPLEVYIRDHSDAEFTHGMCPTCVERWYPGVIESPRPER